MKKCFLVSLFLFLVLVFTKNTYAITDPRSVSNNSFGIHIFSEKDLDDAAHLVNSNGGDWGHVTIVITEAERDHDRWQKVFDRMRKLHLIPIVRLATKSKGEIWEKPTDAEINNWISFLNSLNWVVENRYVIIGNEPNHAREWGGELKPDEYATYLKQFAEKLKNASPDFFVLPAALDASASGLEGTMTQIKYLSEMLKKEPELFDFLDGWNSHSYPNPDFSGAETAKGQKTIAGYAWEIAHIKSLGVDKDLPIFITETGWSSKTLNDEKIAGKFEYAFKNVWKDKNIVAVTPFILNYPQEPFGQFSWKKSDGSFTESYNKVQSLEKVQGEPKQIVKGEILTAITPPVVLSGADVTGIILAKNTGQTIWNQKDISLDSDSSEFYLKHFSFGDIEPMHLGLVTFTSASPETPGTYKVLLFFKGKKGETVSTTGKFELRVFKTENKKILTFFENIKTKVAGLGKLLPKW